MHLRIYRERPDVRAVVHAHPPIATAFGVAGRDFMDAVLPEVIFHLGRVPLVPYAMPGTPALGDAMAPYLAEHDAFLLASHGATTVGPTLRLAHQRMESLEHAARILHAAWQLGPVTPLRAEDVAALRRAREAARLGWEADAARMAVRRGGRMSHETQGHHDTERRTAGEGDSASLTLVESLMAERRKYEHWLAALEARREHHTRCASSRACTPTITTASTRSSSS